MSKEGMEKFFKFLAENREHQAKVQSLGNDVDALAAYAREQGYEFSPEELREYQEEALRVLKGRMKKEPRPEASLSPGAREFYALIQLGETDQEVGKRLAELAAGSRETQKTPEELIAYGREKGFIFNEQDMQNVSDYILEPSDELNEEELRMVAGGDPTITVFVFIAAGAAIASIVVATVWVAVARNK